MNDWRSRILCVLLLLLAVVGHDAATERLSNSPSDMLVFHGSAALIDLFLLYVFPAILTGRLSDASQTLCLVSICINFVGWIAYLAYAPPVIYNALAWGLSYVQWGILLFMDRRDAHRLGFDLVRGSHRKGEQHNFAEATT